MEKPLDEDIESFFSNDETPDNMSISFAHTSRQCPSAQKQMEQQGKFSFHFSSLLLQGYMSL